MSTLSRMYRRRNLSEGWMWLMSAALIPAASALPRSFPSAFAASTAIVRSISICGNRAQTCLSNKGMNYGLESVGASSRNMAKRNGAGLLCMSLSQSSWENEMRGKALVSTKWLAEKLGSEDLVILDVRGEVGKRNAGGGQVMTTYMALKDAYTEAHIPGAAFVDWTRDITDPSTHIPVQLASLDAFASAMEEKGVSGDKTVVVYDNGNMLFATRLWWALIRYGHPDVRVLDGGIKRWQLEGRQTVADDGGCPLKIYGEWQAKNALPSLCVDASAVRNVIPGLSDEGFERGVVLIDARSSEQYAGKQRRSLRAGRIPGAVNMPYKSVIDKKNGGYLSPAESRAILEAGGAWPAEGQKALLYCNGGVASTAVMFNLWQLGVPLDKLANYDGSWGEWGNQENNDEFPCVTD